MKVQYTMDAVMDYVKSTDYSKRIKTDSQSAYSKPKEYSYGWHITIGRTTKLTSYCHNTKVAAGDVVDMILDLEKLNIRYYVNGKDHGIAFINIKKCGYKMAITKAIAGVDKVELISYTSDQNGNVAQDDTKSNKYEN